MNKSNLLEDKVKQNLDYHYHLWKIRSEDYHMLLHSKDGDHPSGISWVNFSPALSNVASQLLLLLKTSYQSLNSSQAHISRLQCHVIHQMLPIFN